MKHFTMTQQKDRAAKAAARPLQRPEAAFDLWLQRGLHQMFDDVAREPVPDELLRLIEGDRGGQAG
jgi:hypothetical protein